MSSEQPTVLVIGATGQTGRLIVTEFDRDPGNVRLRLTARKQAEIERMQSAGRALCDRTAFHYLASVGPGEPGIPVASGLRRLADHT